MCYALVFRSHGMLPSSGHLLIYFYLECFIVSTSKQGSNVLSTVDVLE